MWILQTENDVMTGDLELIAAELLGMLQPPLTPGRWSSWPRWSREPRGDYPKSDQGRVSVLYPTNGPHLARRWVGGFLY